MTTLKTTTYWKAKCLDDHDCYSLRAKTKREVLALLEANGCKAGKDSEGTRCFVTDGDGAAYPRFSWPEKVELRYTDQMDLIRQLRGETACDY